jgi:hypothetical protein
MPHFSSEIIFTVSINAAYFILIGTPVCTIGSDSTSISLLNNRMLILQAISGIITEIYSATMEGGGRY